MPHRFAPLLSLIPSTASPVVRGKPTSRRCTAALLAILFTLTVTEPATAQRDIPRTSSEIKLALDQLHVLGSVLYIAAHPDDENTAFLAAMARGRGMRTAYLAITRGEGGQNLIGPEQGAALGLIRTQELLAARRIDGAEQYFTRAIDFGYSKSAEESLRFWNHDSTLADVVWIIRTFRPDVIVTRFTPQLGGHGHHTASAMLAIEAFDAAADPSRFPEQLGFTTPWKAKRLMWNVFRFGPADTVRTPGTVRIDLGEYSPLLGRSYAELAGEGRSMHKSQGFGAPQNRGEAVNAFQHLRGDTAAYDLFDGVPLTWSRVAGGDSVDALISKAQAAYSVENPAGCVAPLLRVAAALATLPQDPLVRVKRSQVEALIRSCAGIWVELSTPLASAAPGTSVPVTCIVVNRSQTPFILDRIRLPLRSADSACSAPLLPNKPVRIQSQITIPRLFPYSQPYWLETPSSAGAYRVTEQRLRGLAEAPPALVAEFHLSHPQGTLPLRIPLQQKIIDPVDGEVYHPFAVTPPVDIHIRESVLMFDAQATKSLHVSLVGGARPLSGTLHLILPHGWTASPPRHTIELPPHSGEVVYRTQITATAGASSGVALAEVTLDSTRSQRTVESVTYKHIPRQILMAPARTTLLRSGIRSPGGRAAYIEGAGDALPAAMVQLGYQVEALSDDDLALADLSGYDVIVTGIRAYNTRPALRRNQERLMRYVEQGGTYIVHYVNVQRGESESIGPYPLSLSRDRVAEEDAPVTMLLPDHPVFTTPNRITQLDFAGWVQERGLYFADRWDRRYDSLLASCDTGEPMRNGGLLLARYGKGTFLYNAYAFNRQLPAGVEGAYRLFANILALRSGQPGNARDGRTRATHNN